MLWDNKIKDLFTNIIKEGAASALTDKQFLEAELKRWKVSKNRLKMLDGDRYYKGDHDILQRKRQAIGRDGQLIDLTNLPNNKKVDNQYAKMVDQKANYLLSKPLTVETDNEAYEEELNKIFNKRFMRQVKASGVDAYNCGVTWLYPYYDENGNFKFQRFNGFEIMPFWKDSEHTELDKAVRVYPVEIYEGKQLKVIEKVEVYSLEGIERYVWYDDKLIPDVENPSSDYAVINGVGYNWERVPLICFKANDKELPLIGKVKTLQDGINEMLSDFANNMQEDSRNTILVLKNYDGQDLGEFRYNLATYGAVKVKTVDGANGGIETLNIEVNAANYESILKLLKKALIENALGYDAKDDRLGGNANQMNIQSIYNDIDLDADNTEAEYQAAFEQLLWFVNVHLANTGKGDFSNEEVKITFNRDMLMNENEVISMLSNLGLQLSNETLISQVPFVNNVQSEIERLQEEKGETDIYKPFNNPEADKEN